MICSNHGPSAYRFRENGDIGKISQNFPILGPRVFNAPLSWSIVAAIGLKKTRAMTLPDGGKSLTIMCICLDTIPQRVGQDSWTNGQTDGIGKNNIALCMPCIC